MTKLSRRHLVALATSAAVIGTLPKSMLASEYDDRLPLAGQEPAFATPVDGLQFLLKVQYAELALYQAGEALDLDDGTAGLVAGMVMIESAHVDSLTNAIAAEGGTAEPTPAFAFDVVDRESLLATAAMLESAATSCVQGLAGTLISSDSALNAALIVHEMDARQVAIVAAQRGEVPIPLAVHPTLPVSVVEEQLAAFIV